jgi:hypothetical protein
MKQLKFLVLIAFCSLLFFKGSCSKEEEGNKLDKISQLYYIEYDEPSRSLYTYALFTEPNDIPFLLVSPAFVNMNGFTLNRDGTNPTYSLRVTNTSLAANYQWEYNDEQNRLLKNAINFNGRTIALNALPDSVSRTTPVNIGWNNIVQDREKVIISVLKNDTLLFLLEQTVVGSTNLQVIFSPSVVDTSIKKIYLQATKECHADLQQKTLNGGGEIKLFYSSKKDSIILRN